MAIYVVDYVKYDHIYVHTSNVKVLLYYDIMLDIDYVFKCVVLEFMHD